MLRAALAQLEMLYDYIELFNNNRTKTLKSSRGFNMFVRCCIALEAVL